MESTHERPDPSREPVVLSRNLVGPDEVVFSSPPNHRPSLPKRRTFASFRPSLGYLHYLRFFFWIVLVAIDVLLTIAGWRSPSLHLGRILITPRALAIIVLPDIVAYIALHLRYDTMWYVLTDRSLRIRRGIWKIHETTITFENIQNIRLSQGPLQRYFGFANLVVETAGGGSSHGHEGASMAGAHVGMMEGLDNAIEVRNMILAHLKKRLRQAWATNEKWRMRQRGPHWGRTSTTVCCERSKT